MAYLSYAILALSIVNFLLGVIILGRTRSDRSMIAFLFFAGSASIWTLNNFYLRINPDIRFLNISYGLGIVVATLGLVWTHFFLKKLLPRFVSYIILPVSAVLMLVPVFYQNAIIREMSGIRILGYSATASPLFYLYVIYFSSIICFILLLLVRALWKTEDINIRHQIKYVLTGALIFALTSSITSFFYPVIFRSFEFTILDNFSFSFFLIAIVYSILKANLFDIKVVATELFAFLLWFFIFVRTILAGNTQDFVINGILLLLTVTISIFLIRSVVREVEDREKIQKLAEDLERANEQLKILDQQKSEFVSIASHQLRSPLTAIRGYTSMLMEGSYGDIPEKAMEAIDRVSQSSQHLVALVEDLLNISRIESGKMSYNFVSVDLEKMTEDIIGALLPNAQKSKLDLTFETDKDGPYLISADNEKIRQVILNLIDNSIKYTPSGFIKVRLSKDKASNKISLRVEDSGVGVSPELMDRLFEKFSRGDDKNKLHVNGTGLGLYVAKEIIKAHKGDIWVESPGEGKGSTFFVEFMTEEEKARMELTEKENVEHKEKVDEFAKTL